MFFDGWSGVLRVLVVGTLAYLALIAWLRVTGKRTVSKWNAFDLIVTISLGSTLATILLSDSVALVEGLAGMGLLIMLQYLITWLSIRSPWVRNLVKNPPTLLLRNGELQREAMARQRVTEGEVHAALREAGHASPEGVQAVVLETDGTFSVVTSGFDGVCEAMGAVDGFERDSGQKKTGT